MLQSSIELLEATPVFKLVSPISGRTVGYEYMWNTGRTATRWIEKPHEMVVRVPILK